MRLLCRIIHSLGNSSEKISNDMTYAWTVEGIPLAVRGGA